MKVVSELTITDLTSRHLAQANAWLSSATQTLLKLPTSPIGAHSEEITGWAALDGDEVLAIAFVTFTKERVGFLEAHVKPSAQRQGIGSQLVDHALSQLTDLNHLHARIEMGNTAAQKILESRGFSRIGFTNEGLMEYARHPLGTTD